MQKTKKQIKIKNLEKFRNNDCAFTSKQTPISTPNKILVQSNLQQQPHQHPHFAEWGFLKTRALSPRLEPGRCCPVSERPFDPSTFPRYTGKRDLLSDPPLIRPGRLGSTQLSTFTETTPTTHRCAMRLIRCAAQPHGSLATLPSRSFKRGAAALRCGHRPRARTHAAYRCISPVPGPSGLANAVGSRPLRARRLAPVTSSGPSVTGAGIGSAFGALFLWCFMPGVMMLTGTPN
jgi:hypothetical protein